MYLSLSVLSLTRVQSRLRLITCAALYTMCSKKCNGAPLEKSLQSHEDREMIIDQPGLKQKRSLQGISGTTT